MADDQDKYEGQDDSEYHFSDEQMNYEMDDIGAHEDVTKSAAATKSPAAGKKINSRQYMIGVGVFVVLIFMVYKLMVPPAPSTPGEITQVAPPPMPQVKAVPAPRPAPPTVVAQPQVQAMLPKQLPQQPQTMQPLVSSNMPPSAPPVAQPQAPQMMMPPTPMVTATPSIPTTANPADLQAVLHKLDMLAEQNAKMSYQLTTEYPQKFSSYEEQNAALQSKVQDLTSRITALEGDLNQIMQAVKGNGPLPRQGGPSMSSSSSPPPIPPEGQVFQPSIQEPTSPPPLRAEPKMSYSVQAIIPGRAWLKSESGDTITIAEGDVLKDLGRVVKIDPYDGIVEVDTGSKIISLSYGGNAE